MKYQSLWVHLAEKYGLVIHVHEEQDYRSFLFQNSSHFCPPVWWCYFEMLQNVWDARILDSGVNYQREAL